VSSVSNGLYFLTLPLVSVMRDIYTSTSKGMSEKVWGARYTLGVCYLSKNTVIVFRQHTVLFLKVRNKYMFHLVKIAIIKLNI